MKKPFTCLLLLLAFTSAGYAQTFGVFAGLENQLIGIAPIHPDRPDLPAVVADRPSTGAGFGVFARWPTMLPGLYLQPELAMVFTQNTLLFYGNMEGLQRHRYRFIDVELPLHLVFIQPKGTFPLRPTLLVGARIGANVARTSDERLGFLRERLGFDAGLGAAIRLGKWQLQPEVLYSHNLNNVHDVQNRLFDAHAGRMVRDRLTFRVVVCRE